MQPPFQISISTSCLYLIPEYCFHGGIASRLKTFLQFTVMSSIHFLVTLLIKLYVTGNSIQQITLKLVQFQLMLFFLQKFVVAYCRYSKKKQIEKACQFEAWLFFGISNISNQIKCVLGAKSFGCSSKSSSPSWHKWVK